MAAALAILTLPLEQITRSPNRTVDFASFYTAGTIVRSGEWNRLYDVDLQLRVERSVSPGGAFMAYYHPPFEAILFLPLAFLSYPHAFVVWGGLNLVALVLIVFLLRATGHHLDSRAYATWVVTFIFFVICEIAVGQDALWLAVVFLTAFLLLKRRHDYAAGLALGIGLFRFEILLPFVFIFLLRRRWKLFGGFCSMGLLAFLMSMVLVGWNGLLSYAKVLISVGLGLEGAWADRSSAGMMPSLRGAISSLSGGKIPQYLIFPIVLLATILLLGWSARCLHHLDNAENPAFDLEFSLATIAALLASYHVFIGEMTPLILVGYLILAYEGATPRHGILGGRRGNAFLLLFLATIAGLIAVRSLEFSVEAVVLIGMMVWLSQEVLSPEEPRDTGAETP